MTYFYRPRFVFARCQIYENIKKREARKHPPTKEEEAKPQAEGEEEGKEDEESDKDYTDDYENDDDEAPSDTERDGREVHGLPDDEEDGKRSGV